MTPAAEQPNDERARAAWPLLARLVAEPEDFRQRRWGVEPVLTRAGAADLAQLLRAQDVDELLSVRGLRTPFLRMVKDGTTLAHSVFTAGGGVGAGVGDQVSDDKVRRLFADGATIVLQGLHRTWPPILDFVLELAAELGHPVQANAYVTPPSSRGFGAHYDVHDVFVVQLFGRKRWYVHDPVHPWPLRDQPSSDVADAVSAAAAGAPRLDTVLEPGDCLYLPRGFIHSATALGEVSGHLTLGVHVWTQYHLAEAAMAAALAEIAGAEAVRAPLPLGADVGDPADLARLLEAVRDRLHAALAGLDPARIARDLGAQARAAQRPGPIGALAQAAAVRELTPSSLVVARNHLGLRREATSEAGLRLRSRVGSVEVPAIEVPGVDRALSGTPVRPNELPLPEPQALALVHRLLAAGLVQPTDLR